VINETVSFAASPGFAIASNGNDLTIGLARRFAGAQIDDKREGIVMTSRPILIAGLVAITFAAPAFAQNSGTAGDIIGQLLGKAAPANTTVAQTVAPNVTTGEAQSGLKLALSRAADSVVGQLGKPGGFANDPKVRIGLPGPLGKLSGLMSMLDAAGVTDNLSGKLNSAAEGAVGKALPLLKNAISKMSVSDALGLVTGGQTSATDYFKRTMGGELQTQMTPVVSQSLSGVKAFAALNSFTAKNKLPVGQFGANDLTRYVTQKASDGVFYYLGEQERAIRANPVATGSSLLAKVFGIR
jgi:hypothetical protein